MVDDEAEELFQCSERERRFLAFFDSLSGIAIQGYSPRDGVIYWNKASETLYGFAHGEVLGRSLQSFISRADPEIQDLEARIQSWFAGDLPKVPLELVRHHRDGGEVSVLTLPFSFLAEKTPSVLYCIEFDLTAQKRLEFRLRRAASFDAITRLPNRLYLDQELRARIAEARRFQKPLALLFIDLDGFKVVNDALGHAIGDRLLAKAANRMVSVLRHYDFMARLGGDEFVCILPREGNPEAIASIAHKLIGELERPFRLNGKLTQISASIGIAIFPKDGLDGAPLLARADAAMYEAKRNGKGGYRFFAPQLAKGVHFQSHHRNLFRPRPTPWSSAEEAQ